MLLVIIWPANLQAAITAQHSDETTTKVLTWIRLPLQIPLSGSPSNLAETEAMTFRRIP